MWFAADATPVVRVCLLQPVAQSERHSDSDNEREDDGYITVTESDSDSSSERKTKSKRSSAPASRPSFPRIADTRLSSDEHDLVRER